MGVCRRGGRRGARRLLGGESLEPGDEACETQRLGVFERRPKQLLSPLPVRGRAARDQRPGQSLLGADAIGPCPHLLGRGQRGLQVGDRFVGSAERPGQQPEMARHRAEDGGRDARDDHAVSCGQEEIVDLSRDLDVAQEHSRFGQVGERGQPRPIPRQPVQPLCREPLQLGPGFTLVARLGMEPSQDRAPHAQQRRALDQRGHQRDQLGGASLIHADPEYLGRVDVRRILGEDTSADAGSALRKLLGLLDAPGRESERRLGDQDAPGMRRQAQSVGDLSGRCEIAARARGVAQLEVRRDGVQPGLARDLGPQGGIGDAHRFPAQLEPLARIARPDQDIAAVQQDRRQGSRIVRRSGDPDGLVREIVAPLEGVLVVAGRRQAAQDPGTQGRVLLAQGCAGLLEKADLGGVARGLAAYRGEAESGSGQRRGVAELACQPRGLEKRGPLAVAVARGRLHLAEGEEHVEPLGRCSSDHGLLLQHALVVARRLLVRASLARPVPCSNPVVDRPSQCLGAPGTREVQRDRAESRLGLQGALRLECLGHPEVEGAALLGGDVLEGDLAHHRAREPVATGLLGVGLEQVEPDRLGEQRERIGGRQLGGLGEHGQVELPADDGGGGEQAARSRGDRLEAAPGDLAHLVRQRQPRVAPAVAGDQREHLLQEEGVAVGDVAKRRRGIARQLEARCGHQRRDLVRRQRAHDDLAPQTREVGEDARHLAGLAELELAIGCEYRDSASSDLAGDEAQQMERLGIRPLQVVEHDGDRRARGPLHEELGDGCKDAKPHLGRIECAARELGAGGAQARDDVSQLGCSRAEPLGDVGRGPGGGAGTQRLLPGPQRGDALVLTTPAPEDAIASKGVDHLLDEPGLADPGFARDERHRAAARQGSVEVGAQHGDLRAAAHEAGSTDGTHASGLAAPSRRGQPEAADGRHRRLRRAATPPSDYVPGPPAIGQAPSAVSAGAIVK